MTRVKGRLDQVFVWFGLFMACVDAFVEIVMSIVLIMRRPAEKSQHKVIDRKRGDNTIDDGAAHCHACKKG